MRTFSTLMPLITTFCFSACSGDGASRAKDGAGGFDGVLIDPGPDAGVPDTIPPEVGPNNDLGVGASGGASVGTGGSGGIASIPSADAGHGGTDGAISLLDAGRNMTPPVVAYRYSLHYFKDTADQAVAGTALLTFAAGDDCKLLNAVFTTNAADFTAAPAVDSSNFCQPFVTLLLSGGLFDGVSVRLRNLSSDPMEIGFWEFVAECSGQGIENCSGRLERID